MSEKSGKSQGSLKWMIICDPITSNLLSWLPTYFPGQGSPSQNGFEGKNLLLREQIFSIKILIPQRKAAK